MVKRTKALNKDSDGFAIPDKLVNNNENDNFKENWSLNNEGISQKNYTKLQLQNRCRLYKIIKTSLENPKQKDTLTNSTFNQIYRNILEPITHSFFLSGLKEIVKLILEGAGIPSIFIISIKNWLECNKIESNLNKIIFDIQDNNINFLQYYPIKPKKQSEIGFEESYMDFFSKLGEKFVNRLQTDNEFDSLEITMNWLKEFGRISLRPLRHSGTVALNGMLKGIIKGKKEIFDKINRFKNQIENECQNSKAFKSMEEEISKNLKLFENLDGYICNILDDFWKPRAQDISEDIRLNCLKTMSEGIIKIQISEVLSKVDILEFLFNILNEDIYNNRIFILNCILNCFEIEKLRKNSEHIFKNKDFLKNLKNMIILASKVSEDYNIVKCGELSLLLLYNILKKELLDENFIDEIVDLIWLNSYSIEISILLVEFIDFALFDGGITHNNVETQELIELASKHTENRKLRNMMNLENFKSLDSTRMKSDLQTLLEFIHEFGKDFVTLTHRCVNVFWTKVPCVRDTRFLIEVLVSTECSLNSEVEPLNQEIKKTLLLVLHSNVSYIEEISTNIFNNSSNLIPKTELLFGKYRAYIAISVIFEYMESLILLHENNTDHLTILLSTFSTCMSLYCKFVEYKDNLNITLENIKHLPVKKLILLFKSHSDPRIIDGISMIFSPVFNQELKQHFNENFLSDIKLEISELKKELFEDFLSKGREYLSSTDSILYSSIIDDAKKSKKNNSKNSKARNSTINTICKFRRVYAIIKYLTIDNIYLNYEDGILKSSNSVSEMSPEQGSGIPFSFEVLVEVLERSERIIQDSNDDILVHQTAQLFCVTLDILITGYTHLVQDLLKKMEDDSNTNIEKNERFNLIYIEDKELSIEIFKSLRHKFSCILIDTIRYNLGHHFNNHQCFNYLSLLSISSILVIFGLQGLIENTLKDVSIETEVKWSISDSDLSLVIREYIYWTSFKNQYLNYNKENEKTQNISYSLIDGFNNLINFCKQSRPYYLLYPNCRVFEPLDNLKDESYVTTVDTLNIYKKKLNEFMENQFLPACILSLLAVSSEGKSTMQMFTPVILNYLMDIEEFMMDNYYIEIIHNFQEENDKSRLIFSNKFLEFLFSNDDSQILGPFSCILILMIINYKDKNLEKTKLLSKKLIPTYTNKVGWKKMEEMIKLNISDLNNSIIECLRFSLFGTLNIPIYKDIISRDEIIVENVKTKGFIKYYLDFLTTQNASGGNKSILNLLTNEEVNVIFDRIKALCNFDEERSISEFSHSINRDLFERDIKNFLDSITDITQKKNSKKDRNYKINKISEYNEIEISNSEKNLDDKPSESKYQRKRSRRSKSVNYNSEDEFSFASLSDFEMQNS